MDTSAPSPRVNGELMGRFVGKKVLLVGKNEGSDGSTMTVRTPDEKTVTVQLAPGSPAPRDRLRGVRGHRRRRRGHDRDFPRRLWR